MPEASTEPVKPVPVSVYEAATWAATTAACRCGQAITHQQAAIAVVNAVAPMIRDAAYRDGWADGRQLGILHGRHEAAADIQRWADTPPGPWDWPAPHVVDGAIAAARGPYADEGADRG